MLHHPVAQNSPAAPEAVGRVRLKWSSVNFVMPGPRGSGGCHLNIPGFVSRQRPLYYRQHVHNLGWPPRWTLHVNAYQYFASNYCASRQKPCFPALWLLFASCSCRYPALMLGWKEGKSVGDRRSWRRAALGGRLLPSHLCDCATYITVYAIPFM